MTKKIVKPDSTTPQRKHVQAITEGQKKYLNAIRDNDITLCVGPAGSGKTHLAIGQAVWHLLARSEKQVDKIIMCRPVVCAEEDLGALPGDISEKMHPFLLPLYDEMQYFAQGQAEIREWLNTGRVEIAPLAFMRGRTFKHAFIILDEAQNCTLKQLKMFLSRLGEGSKIVITGDLSQSDLRAKLRGGLDFCVERLVRLDGVAIVELGKVDIVRHPLVGPVMERLDESR